MWILPTIRITIFYLQISGGNFHNFYPSQKKKKKKKKRDSDIDSEVLDYNNTLFQ